MQIPPDQFFRICAHGVEENAEQKQGDAQLSRQQKTAARRGTAGGVPCRVQKQEENEKHGKGQKE